MCKIDILLFGNIPNNNCAFFIISSSFYCIKLSIFCFGTANADYVLIWIMLHKYGTGSGYLGLKAFTLFLLVGWCDKGFFFKFWVPTSFLGTLAHIKEICFCRFFLLCKLCTTKAKLLFSSYSVILKKIFFQSSQNCFFIKAML